MDSKRVSPLPKVLVVDDDSSVVGVMRRILDFECELFCASSAKEALEVLNRDGPFAVVLTDFRMPGGNGTDLVLEARKRFPETVYMLLTGMQDDRSLEVLRRVQPFRILWKPCEMVELRKAVADAVHHYQQGFGSNDSK